MAIVSIPVSSVAYQTVNATLSDQNCTIVLRTLGDRQYFSLSISGTIICENILMQNRTGMVRASYSGFSGEIIAIDTQGDEPPAYDGWGTRWLLLFNEDI